MLLGNNNLIVGSSSSTTFAGVMDGSGGTGGLIKQGSGTLTLSGTNTYTGGTTINAGLINFDALANFGTGTDHPERRRPAMGDRQHASTSRRSWRWAQAAPRSTPTATTSPWPAASAAPAASPRPAPAC